MAEKVFIQNFENFAGLDLKTSDLTRNQSYSKALTNFEFGEGYSLRKRRGVQAVGQPGAFTGVHTYSYYDTVTGATTQQLIAINDHLWKLIEAALTVTRVAGSASGISYTVRLDTSSTPARYRFVLNQASLPLTLVNQQTAESHAWLDLGTGLEEQTGCTTAPTGGVVTMLDLYEAIDAHANFTCSRPPRTARVNGDQIGVSAITVDAGHNIAVGDILTLWDFSTNKLVGRSVTAVGATTITFNSIYGTVTVDDNQVLGPGSAPATSVLIADAIDPTGSPYLAYRYWDWVRPNFMKYADFARFAPFSAHFASRTYGAGDWKPPCFVNAGQSCYIFTGSQNQSVYLHSHEDRPYKYDGQNIYRAGVPRPESGFSTATGGAGALTGIYKYAVRHVQKDKKGLTYFSNTNLGKVEVTYTAAAEAITLTVPSFRFAGSNTDRATANGLQVAVNTITVLTGHIIKAGDIVTFLDNDSANYVRRTVTATTNTTITVSGGTVGVFNGEILYSGVRQGFLDDGVTVNGNQANVKTITVLAGHRFLAGDVIYLFDRKRTRYGERTLTAVTSTTITWGAAEDDVNVNNGDVFTKNLRIEIFRTKAGGNLFYKVNEIPDGIDGEQVVYVDNLADTALGAQLDDPEIGREHDVPPKTKFACLHQGLLIYTGDNDSPNSIAWSDVDGLEYVPLASNYADIPSNITSPITAVASDSDNYLAIFKETGYYNASGDFTTSNFIIRAVKEGDYGVSSHASLVKIDGKLIGVGKLGFIAVKDGELSPEIGLRINPAILNNSNVLLGEAVGMNDYSGRRYRCYIPNTVGYSDGTGIANDLMFVYDHEKDVWFDWDYAASLEPSGGFATYGDVPYYLSKAWKTGDASVADNSGHLFREINISTVSQNYADNHLAITSSWRTQAYHFDLPSIDKEYLRAKIWSIYSDFDSDQFVASTNRVRTYRNFQSTTADSDFSLNFTLVTEFEKLSKLKSNKARAMHFLIEESTFHQCPQYTGLEIVVAASYLEEDMKK